MIAQPNQHFDDETLRLLLDEQLPLDVVQNVESHLCSCDECRQQLEKIAGQGPWWDETVDVLAESTLTPKDSMSMELRASDSLDASLDWIRPLLDQSPQEALGHAEQNTVSDATPPCLGRIGQYLVQGVIGQGGMGVVLRGIDVELNRPVAIKVLSPHLAGVGAARSRFMREAQAAAAVVHPSIVPIYSVVTGARLPYIVMPCINGGNLQQRIQKEGPLEIDEVLRIGLQIAEGLSAAHRHGVIHRDIKPANILIEEGNGRALISDFGLARALDDATLTNSGMIAGTPQYMSPEQALGGPIDARSDLFSLGSLLYASATGRPPFRAESPLAVLRKISETQPRPIHQINERVPVWFDTLVGQLMKIDIDQRVPDATTAADRLREAHAHVRNPSVHPLPSALRRRGPSSGWLVAGLLLVSLVGLGEVLRRSFQKLAPPTSAKVVSGESESREIELSNSPPPAIDHSVRDSMSFPWRDDNAERELRAIQSELSVLAETLEMDAPPPTTFSKPLD